MQSVISQNLVVILIVLAIGMAVAWWLFRRPRDAQPIESKRTEQAPSLDGPEGNSLADEHAAAAADIAGQFLQAEVHEELPGASGPPDDLRTLKGVGPKLADKLNANGIIRFDQLASLTPAQAAALDGRMEPFTGRIARDRLIEQAGYLARGDKEGFEQRFGKLGG